MQSTKAFECQPTAQCEYLDAHPDKEVLLFLRVNKAKRVDPLEGQITYSETEAEHNRACLAEFLNANGLKADLEGPFAQALQDVEVVGRYGSMAEIVRQLDSVWDVEIVCQDKAKCDDCKALDDAACLSTPLCGVLDAVKREGAMCVRRGAACLPFDALCSDKPPFGVRDPQQACWVLGADCIGFPPGWSRDIACESAEVGCALPR